MGSGWKIGRVAGIDIAIHPSWLVIAFLLTLTLADGFFPERLPGWSVTQYWLLGGATALLFFASVLAHELSHAIVARRFGLKVQGITLFIFVPGYPMDGGRVLRAILWRLRGDANTATRQAAMVGRVVGYVMVAGGIF